MSLDFPDVYLIGRAPRCLCHASPRPRPADGANGAMHTLGGHMQMKVKQGHSGTRRDVICWQLPPEGWRRLPQYYLRPILNGAADVLPTWCYTDRGGEVNARGVRPLANKYGMRHITSCASARRVGWCRAAQCGDDSAKKTLRFTRDLSTRVTYQLVSYRLYYDYYYSSRCSKGCSKGGCSKRQNRCKGVQIWLQGWQRWCRQQTGCQQGTEEETDTE